MGRSGGAPPRARDPPARRRVLDSVSDRPGGAAHGPVLGAPGRETRMRRWGLAALAGLTLLAPALASAQAFGPAHHFSAVVGPAWGGSTLRPAFNRRLLV